MSKHRHYQWVTRKLIAFAVGATACVGVQSQSIPTPGFLPAEPMDDELRSALRKVVVKPGGSPVNEELAE